MSCVYNKLYTWYLCIIIVLFTRIYSIDGNDCQDHNLQSTTQEGRVVIPTEEFINTAINDAIAKIPTEEAINKLMHDFEQDIQQRKETAIEWWNKACINIGQNQDENLTLIVSRQGIATLARLYGLYKILFYLLNTIVGKVRQHIYEQIDYQSVKNMIDSIDDTKNQQNNTQRQEAIIRLLTDAKKISLGFFKCIKEIVPLGLGFSGLQHGIEYCYNTIQSESFLDKLDKTIKEQELGQNTNICVMYFFNILLYTFCSPEIGQALFSYKEVYYAIEVFSVMFSYYSIKDFYCFRKDVGQFDNNFLANFVPKCEKIYTLFSNKTFLISKSFIIIVCILYHYSTKTLLSMWSDYCSKHKKKIVNVLKKAVASDDKDSVKHAIGIMLTDCFSHKINLFFRFVKQRNSIALYTNIIAYCLLTHIPYN